MKLHIKDRIYLLSILPQKAVNYKTFNLKKELGKNLELTKEDHEKYKIVTDEETNSINWDPALDLKEPLDLSITPELAEYLKNACESISENEYTDDVWNLVERIFEECSKVLDCSYSTQKL